MSSLYFDGAQWAVEGGWLTRTENVTFLPINFQRMSIEKYLWGPSGFYLSLTHRSYKNADSTGADFALFTEMWPDWYVRASAYSAQVNNTMLRREVFSSSLLAKRTWDKNIIGFGISYGDDYDSDSQTVLRSIGYSVRAQRNYNEKDTIYLEHRWEDYTEPSARHQRLYLIGVEVNP